MGRPYSVIKGTPKVPPPIPIRVEKNANTVASTPRKGWVGICVPKRQSARPKAIYSPATMAKKPKIAFKDVVDRKYAAITPINDPNTKNGAHEVKIPQSTAPFLLCKRTDRTEVTTMVAADVPMQTCIRWSDAKPNCPNR